MTAKRTTHLRREQVAHLVRAAAAITNEDTFVLVGTGAVIAQLKSTPFDLMATREVDLYAPGAADPAAVSDLIDGSIGEGSPFDETFGYHAHGVGEDTAILPHDWRLRARAVALPTAPGTTCICPALEDVALAKLCAWREKDRLWLTAARKAGLVTGAALKGRARAIIDTRAPQPEEIERRIDALATEPSSGGSRTGRGEAAASSQGRTAPADRPCSTG